MSDFYEAASQYLRTQAMWSLGDGAYSVFTLDTLNAVLTARSAFGAASQAQCGFADAPTALDFLNAHGTKAVDLAVYSDLNPEVETIAKHVIGLANTLAPALAA